MWERKAFGAERKACRQMLRGKVLGMFRGQFSACCALSIDKGNREELPKGDETMGELTKGPRQEEKMH